MTRGEDGFHLPARAEWEKALTPKTRARPPLQPEQPDRHRLHEGGDPSARRSSAATTASSSSPTRSTGSSSTTAASPSAPSRCAGFEDEVVVVDSPLEALLGLRHPARRPRHAQRRRGRRLQPHGPGPPLAAGPRPGHRAGRAGARARVLPGRRARVPEEARHALRGALEDPRRLPPQARGRLLLRRAPARSRTATTSPPGSSPTSRSTERPSWSRPRAASTSRRASGKDEIRIAYVLKDEDLRDGRRHPRGGASGVPKGARPRLSDDGRPRVRVAGRLFTF